MNTRRDGSSGGYSKLVEMVQTCHEMANGPRYEQCEVEKPTVQQTSSDDVDADRRWYLILRSVGWSFNSSITWSAQVLSTDVVGQEVE